jgi:hypothetical protein
MMTRPKALIGKLLNERRREKSPRGRQAEEVEAENEAVRARLAELAEVLTNRRREPAVSPLVLEHLFRRHGAERFCARAQAALMASPYPLGVPGQTRVLGYQPETRELIVERDLPHPDVIPAEQEFRVIGRTMRPVARKSGEIRQLYKQLLTRCALRTLAEVFALTPGTLVHSVVLDGRVTTLDTSTGKVISPHLLSVQVDRAAYEGLDLDAPDFDPEMCLRAQNALVSPEPHDLVPIEPLLRAS